MFKGGSFRVWEGVERAGRVKSVRRRRIFKYENRKREVGADGGRGTMKRRGRAADCASFRWCCGDA